MSGEKDLQAMAAKAAEMTMVAPTVGLTMLLAEMKALTTMMPGMTPTLTPAEEEAQRRAEDAAVEASFDNMPV